jgi:hypothetical protein
VFDLIGLRLRVLGAGLLIGTTLIVAPAAEAGQSSGGAVGGGKIDRALPTLSITAPSGGAVVSDQIMMKGTASDNVGVARVQVSVDGGSDVVAAGTSSWSSPLDTTRLGNGSHSVTARATDGSGNASLVSVSFSVSNVAASADAVPPSVAIASPVPGATVAREIAVSGTSSDDRGVAMVEVKLDGGAFQAAAGTANWAASVDASAAADGQHVLTVRATDSAGNVASSSVTVAVGERAVTAPAMSSGTIGGYVFQEQDRDGVLESSEQPLAGVYVYLYNSAGVYLGNAPTDATGWYRFPGLPDASYRVELAPISWNPLQGSWVSDSTGTIFPRATVSLSGTVRADFGMRRIVRSTDAGAPVSSYLGANGLTVKSYDDAVSAREIYDRLMTGTLVGTEAKDVTIRFDFAQSGNTSSLAVQSNGVYTDYRATSDVTWAGWLRGDGELLHEYGHAWSMSYACMIQADSTLRAYLQARGLGDDARVGTAYAWRAGEMIAEDYRQLFGTASAQADSQMNRDIPPAKDVPGLKAFLSSTYMQTRVD